MRLIILAILIYILYRVFRSFSRGHSEVQDHQGGGEINEMVQDPVCGTYVRPADAERMVIGGREYYFCSKECAEKFQNQN